MTDELIARMVEAGAGTMPASLHHLDVKALTRACVAAALRAGAASICEPFKHAGAILYADALDVPRFVLRALADRMEAPDANG